MDEQAMLGHLEALAHGLGIPIRYENMDSEPAWPRGGLCRIRDKQFIIVNKEMPLKEKVETLAKALNRFDLSRIYLIPALRDFLEKFE